MSAYSPPTRRIPSCSSDYPQCEAEAHTLFPLPSHQIKAQNLSFLKRYRQIFSFRVLKRQILLPFAQKQTKTLSVFAVALHPEGVDRNSSVGSFDCQGTGVALHPEGVDRNFHGIQCFLIELWSPSTRRAWIEIGFSDPFSDAVPVRAARSGLSGRAYPRDSHCRGVHMHTDLRRVFSPVGSFGFQGAKSEIKKALQTSI